MGGPNTGRPSVSDSCTQEEELTGDEPTHLREDREGRARSPLRDKSFFECLLIWWKQTCDQVGLVCSSITIRHFIVLNFVSQKYCYMFMPPALLVI